MFDRCSGGGGVATGHSQAMVSEARDDTMLSRIYQCHTFEKSPTRVDLHDIYRLVHCMHEPLFGVSKFVHCDKRHTEKLFYLPIFRVR